jgi:hypothetical protein
MIDQKEEIEYMLFCFILLIDDYNIKYNNDQKWPFYKFILRGC